MIKFYQLHFTDIYMETSTRLRTFSKLAQPVNQTLSPESLILRCLILNQGLCVHGCACVRTCDNMKHPEGRMDGPQKMLVTWRKRQTCFKDFWLERLFDRHLQPRPPVTPFLGPLTQFAHVANAPSITRAPYVWFSSTYQNGVCDISVHFSRQREPLSCSERLPHKVRLPPYC